MESRPGESKRKGIFMFCKPLTNTVKLRVDYRLIRMVAGRFSAAPAGAAAPFRGREARPNAG